MNLVSISRITKSADFVVEYGIYLFVFATFLSTSLWQLALTAVFLAWIVKHGVTKGRHLDYAHHSLVAYGLVFGLLLLLSTLYAVDTVHGLKIYKNTIGAAMILLLVIPDIFRDEKKRARLLWALALTGLCVALVQTGRYAFDFLADGELKNYPFYRKMSEPLLFYAPFALAMYCLGKGKASVFWGGVFVAQLALLLATGARAVWLGIAIGILLWLVLKAERKLVGLAAVLALAFGVLLIFSQGNLVIKRINEGGLTINDRIERVWKPAYEMIAERPWTGHGFGDFYGELVRHSEQHPWWPVGRPGPYGPHNNYLEIWFSAGIGALVCMILMFAHLFRRLVEYVRQRHARSDVYLGLAVLTSFVASYFVRAVFEDVGWRQFGLLLGIGTVLSLSMPRSDSKST